MNDAKIIDFFCSDLNLVFGGARPCHLPMQSCQPVSGTKGHPRATEGELQCHRATGRVWLRHPNPRSPHPYLESLFTSSVKPRTSAAVPTTSRWVS